MGINKDFINISNSKFNESLTHIASAFKTAGVYSSTSLMKTGTFAEGVNFGNQALNSAFFKPNIIFLNTLENESSILDYPAVIEEARALGLGVILYVPHPKALLGQQLKINIWIDDREGNWNIEKGTGNINLAILTAYKLKLNWNADIRLISVIKNSADTELAAKFLSSIIDLARLPITDKVVLVGEVDELLADGPYADLNIFPFKDVTHINHYSEMIYKTNTSCLFIQDSGNENILA